ncbi:MAG: ABC transporter substrate-binding protein [Rhodospirillales bacterium]|nr:ABC transporter substrate-binding protein [Rhodospirillales bacterium]
MMRLRSALLSAVAVSALAMPAAAQELRMGISPEPTSVDPHALSSFVNMQLGLTVFGHLVNFDSKFRLAPGLATSWKAIDDKTWEFKLRDTKWQDGTPFTADDVIFTFGRAPDVGLKQFAIYIRGRTISKVDDRTIHIKTTVPDPTLPNAMAAFAIVSKKHGDAKTEDYNSGKAAIGIGPYKFVEWVKGDRIVLDANPAYWGGKPAYDRIVMKPISSGPSRVAALMAGDIDFIEKVPTGNISQLKKDAKLNIVQTPSCRTMFLGPDSSRDVSPFVKTNDGQPYPGNPLRDWRVRKAISKAIDRKAIVERVMDGNALAASQYFASGLFGHNPNIPVEPYDLAGAKKLMQDAGYGDGFRLTIHGTNDRYDNDAQILEALAQMLTQVGIKTEIVGIPVATYFTRQASLEFSVYLVGNCPGTAEAGAPLKEITHTLLPEKGYGIYNFHRYSNQRLDTMIEEALSTIDDGKREKLYQDALKIALDDVAAIPLHQQVNTWAMKKGIIYEPRTDEMLLPAYVSKGN